MIRKAYKKLMFCVWSRASRWQHCPECTSDNSWPVALSEPVVASLTTIQTWVGMIVTHPSLTWVEMGLYVHHAHRVQSLAFAHCTYLVVRCSMTAKYSAANQLSHLMLFYVTAVNASNQDLFNLQ